MTIAAATLPTIRPVGIAEGRDPALDAAERMVGALATRDYARLFGMLSRDARLRYLIPSGPGQVAGAADVAAKCFEWFGAASDVEVQEALVQRVSDRTSVRYRFSLRKGRHQQVVEQQAYLDVDAEGRIAAMELLCSGFRPAGEAAGASASGTHEFDAGDMGCADGLAAEFQRRIGAIPVGDVLKVIARDPAAKEDLPSLTRLMGHSVRSVETPGDGRLVITVERTR